MFLETFEFKAAPATKPLLQAIHILRHLNATNIREIPEDAPIGFVRKRWESLVLTQVGIDRRFYELCVLSELKNALRSGDLWVSGSRQFNDFKEYMLSPGAFTQLQKDGFRLDVEINSEKYLNKRMQQLQDQFVKVNDLAKLGKLPDVAITKGIFEDHLPILFQMRRQQQ